MALLAGMITLSCALLLVGGFLPMAQASSGSIAAIPVSGPQGTIVGIQNQFTTTGESIELFFTVVITPSGSEVACTFSNLGCPVTALFSGTAGGTASCTVPYGGLAFFSSAGTTGAVTVSLLCDPPHNNTVSWAPVVSPKSVADLKSMCTSATPIDPLTAGAGTTGATSEIGTYNVVTCWVDINGGPGSAFATTFDIFQSRSVPEFPLGTVVLVGVAAAAVVVLRAGVGKKGVLSASP